MEPRMCAVCRQQYLPSVAEKLGSTQSERICSDICSKYLLVAESRAPRTGELTMKTIKTADLVGPALRWAVATAENMKFMVLTQPDYGQQPYVPTKWIQFWDQEVVDYVIFEPDINWSQGGPIIDREVIMFMWHQDGIGAYLVRTGYATRGCLRVGKTHLIAAMRCFVASRLGDEVDIPDELAP